MKIVMIEIEDSKFEQFILVLKSLKSDLVKNYEVQKQEIPSALAIDPLAQELKRQIQEIDEKVAVLTPFQEEVDVMKERMRLKYASA